MAVPVGEKTVPFNEFHPGRIWPDTAGAHINAHGGGVLLHEGVYYWFGEHKTGGKAGNLAHVGVGVYSSTDLYNWTNRGIAMSVSHDPSSPIFRGCVIERPKVLFNAKTRKFVMWFHLELAGMGYGAAQCAVAVSDEVTGPYRFVRNFRPDAGVWPANVPAERRKPLSAEQFEHVKSLNMTGGPPARGYPIDLVYRRDFEGGQMSRDMTLFADDDGTAYQIRASEDNGTLHVSRLSDDYLGTAGEYVRVFAGRFHEAPAVFKHGGRYFMFSSDCTGWASNAARLSVADAMLGTWTELGNPCRGTPEQVASTFESQSTHVLPVAGKSGAFIFMADRWRPDDAIDGRYIWLPVEFDENGIPFLQWQQTWDLSAFQKGKSPRPKVFERVR